MKGGGGVSPLHPFPKATLPKGDSEQPNFKHEPRIKKRKEKKHITVPKVEGLFVREPATESICQTTSPFSYNANPLGGLRF
jgi:hypothetical protein